MIAINFLGEKPSNFETFDSNLNCQSFDSMKALLGKVKYIENCVNINRRKEINLVVEFFLLNFRLSV